MIDRGFSKRTKTAKTFEEQLFDRVKSLGFSVAVNGTEHTHSDFTNALYRSTDQTSLAIRFQPDAVACIGSIPRSLYVEAKAAKNIERTAYEQYTKLHANGNIVTVVFEKMGWRWNFIESIRLEDGRDTVGKFPPEKRFPVDANGWICPRAGRRWARIKARNPQASGTPYREVIESSLLDWAVFKKSVIAMLKTTN